MERAGSDNIKILIKKIDSSFIDENYDMLYRQLYDERRLAVDRLKNRKAVYVSMTAGITLMELLRRELGLTPDKLAIACGSNGKPYLADYPEFHFNISHSGEYVVAACGNCELGVDIEGLREADLAVARRCFTSDEKEYVLCGNVDETSERFFRIWTMKEAYLKYTGQGISVPLNSFSVDAKRKCLDNGEYVFEEFVFDGYILNVCTEEKRNIKCYFSEKYLDIGDRF